MIQIADNIWIGSSNDEIVSLEMTAILNVAVDMPRHNTKRELIYAQCGLIDGPGNQLAVYKAAVLMLKALVADKRRILVCCHEGGRAFAVCLMYMHTVSGHSWHELLGILVERLDDTLPFIHDSHKQAFQELACKK